MKKSVFALILIQAVAVVAVAQESPAASVVTSFYNALKAGDVATLQTLIDEPLYSEVHVLLTQNTEYPNFLRSHYEGSLGTIQSLSNAGTDEATVYFDVTYKDGTINAMRFRLRAQPDGSWKIAEQLPAD